MLALLAGIAGGVVMGAFAAARRNDTAVQRFLGATGREDAYVSSGFFFRNSRLDYAKIARLPEVQRAARVSVLAAIMRTPRGRAVLPVRQGVVALAAVDGVAPDAVNRPKILAGRLPDPARSDEVLADRKALRFLGVRLGDRVPVHFIPRRLLGSDRVSLAYGAWYHPRDLTPGPRAGLRVVGVEARPLSDDLPGFLHLPFATYRAYGGSALGSWQDTLRVRLRNGVADLPAFDAEVRRIAGRGNFAIIRSEDERAGLERSIHVESQALRLVGLLAAIVAAILIGQALGRQSQIGSSAYPTLSALGMTPRQLVALGAARAGIIAAVAAVVAIAVAIGVSPLAPVGAARPLEPRAGFSADDRVLWMGAVAIGAVLLLSGLAATAKAVRELGPAPSSSRPATHRSPGAAATVLARASLPPALGAGLRMALVRRGAPSAVPVRATVIGAVTAVTVAAAALTVSASVSHLFATPQLYGQNWDFGESLTLGGNPWSNSVEAGLNAYSFDDSIGAAAAGTVTTVDIGGRPVGVQAFDNLKGRISPTIVAGRAPRTDSELLLGGRTLHALHVRIGDRVGVGRSGRAAPFRVVGTGVLPEGRETNLGDGAALTFQGLKRVAPGAARDEVRIRVAKGADRAAVLADLQDRFAAPLPTTPSQVADLGRTRDVSWLVTALLGTAAAAALGHCLLTSVRARRRDLAVLKTLGFVRRQIVAAVAWQAATIAAIGLLIGLPLGIAAGRFLWVLLADNLGVLPEAVVPALPTLLMVPLTIAVAILISAPPGLTAARTQPALVLRAE